MAALDVADVPRDVFICFRIAQQYTPTAREMKASGSGKLQRHRSPPFCRSPVRTSAARVALAEAEILPSGRFAERPHKITLFQEVFPPRSGYVICTDVKRFLLLGLSMSCLAQTQTSHRDFKPTGSAQFEADSDGVVVHFGGRDWKPDLSRLPLKATDCPENPEAERACANARLACLTCITLWEPVAWDEPREVFYMAAGVGEGKNRPWIIFAYDLRSGRIRRIGTDDGGGFNGAAMSPSGRYLAYIGFAVCGICCTTSDLRVIDTQTLTTGSFGLPTRDEDDRPRVLAVRWAGPSTIEYDAQIVRESACREGKNPDASRTASVQVAQILK